MGVCIFKDPLLFPVRSVSCQTKQDITINLINVRPLTSSVIGREMIDCLKDLKIMLLLTMKLVSRYSRENTIHGIKSYPIKQLIK